MKHLLILSGTHGDEYEVIDSVKKYLRSYASHLPKYMYIPKVSPSAVKLKTRNNKYGRDLNRSFIGDSTDPEVHTFKKKLHDKRFNLCLDFHEDPGVESFYCYDSAQMSSPELATMKKSVTYLGISLFSGIDDPTDPVLGHNIVDGYVHVSSKQTKIDPGTWGWLLNNKIAERIIIFEVPGLLSLPKKDNLVRVCFEIVKCRTRFAARRVEVRNDNNLQTLDNR